MLFLMKLTERHISTHILTRRMTQLQPGWTISLVHFNSHPHEEGDCEVTNPSGSPDISTHILTRRMTESLRNYLADTRHFNSHPHEEDDGWFKNSDSNHFISTHILTRRMTVEKIGVGKTKIFQLTSSQGG